MELKGMAASPGIIMGKVFVVDNLQQNADEMEDRQILVMRFSTPAYFEFFIKASAIITETGGITCHAASLARDLNIPCVVSVNEILAKVKNNDLVTVDGNNGVIYV